VAGTRAGARSVRGRSSIRQISATR